MKPWHIVLVSLLALMILSAFLSGCGANKPKNPKPIAQLVISERQYALIQNPPAAVAQTPLNLSEYKENIKWMATTASSAPKQIEQSSSKVLMCMDESSNKQQQGLMVELNNRLYLQALEIKKLREWATELKQPK